MSHTSFPVFFIFGHSLTTRWWHFLWTTQVHTDILKEKNKLEWEKPLAVKVFFRPAAALGLLQLHKYFYSI